MKWIMLAGLSFIGIVLATFLLYHFIDFLMVKTRFGKVAVNKK